MTPLRSIRLYPTESEFLEQYRMDNGDIFYDKDTKTLVVYDGNVQGGIPLLRADLSNISGGGGGGAGTVNFGAKTLQAQSFIGDGSQLTNLPLPTNIATLTDVQNAFNTIATATTLGTVKIGTGLSIDSQGLLTADSVANLTTLSNMDSIQFKVGAAISEFSTDGLMAGNSPNAVPTESAVKTYVDNSIDAIDLEAAGVIENGIQGEIPIYDANGVGNVLSSAGTNLKWVSNTNTLTTSNITVSNDVVVNNNLTVDETLLVNGGAVVGVSLAVPEIFDNGLGVFTLRTGSDFIIDTPGDVNVKNSRITNLAPPIELTDAVNKQYVDGAASAFQGGTVPNAIDITSSTASTSTTTGALTVAGGVGVGGAMYVGGTIFSNGSAVLTSLSGGFNGGTISGTIFVNNATASTSTTTGALRVTGGVGIGRSLYAGGDGFFNGIRFGNGAAIGSGFAQNVAIGGGTGINAPLGSNVSGFNDIAIGFSTLGQHTDGSDNIAIGNSVMSDKTVGSQCIGIGTDALKLHQGAANLAIGYLAGSAILSGDNNVIIGGNSGSGIDGLNSHVIIADGVGTIKLQFNNTGAISFDGTDYGSLGKVLSSRGSVLPPEWVDPPGFTGGTVANDASFTSNTASTSTTTGAVTITGGVGIGGALNVGGIISGASIQNTPIGSVTRSTGAFTTLTANSAVTLTAGTASSSTGTGTLVVTGGVGVSGATNIGGALSSGGAVTFTQNTASSSTTTGTLVVTGGVGVSGALNVGGALAAGVISGTSIQNTPIGSTTANTGTFTSLSSTSFTTTGTATIQQSAELFQTINAATGVVTHNWAAGSIFLHTNTAADFTANFTNVPTTNNYSYSAVLIIVQGATGRRPTAVQIAGAAQTINWANNIVPTAVSSRRQIFSFSFIRSGGTWTVLGSSQSY